MENKFYISFIGRSAKERGINEVLKFISDEYNFFILNYPEIHFLLQINNNIFKSEKNSLGLSLLNKLKDAANVDLLQNRLSNEEYTAIIFKTKIGFCLVDSKRYKYATSGTALEYILNGIPIVSTKNNWVADMIKKHDVGGRILLNGFDMKNSLLEIYSNYTVYKTKAEKAAIELQKIHNPTNYMKCIENIYEDFYTSVYN